MSTPSNQGHSFRAQSKKGFTLIELITVMTIVIILGSILFVALGGVRSTTEKMENVANLRTIANAWFTYAADNQNFFPIGLTWEPSEGQVTNPPAVSTMRYRYWWRWHGGVASYLPTLTISDTEAARSYGGPDAPTWGTVYRGYYPPSHFEKAKARDIKNVGYHFNRHIGFNARTNIADIIAPSRTPILFAYWDEDGSNPMGQYFSSAYYDQNLFMANATKTLGDGNHFLFADGHVEWVNASNDLNYYRKHFTWRPGGDN